MRILRHLTLGIIFFLVLSSQVTVTPLGEQMDFFGHISYVCFLQRTGTIPRPQAPTVPAGIEKIESSLPSPDTGSGERYIQWAAMDTANRNRLKQAALDPANLQTEFTQPNYQAQHPPLYYLILSPIYGWISEMPLDQKNLILSLSSLFLATLAIPAVYLIFEQTFGPRGGFLATLIVIWLPNFMPFLGRITNDCLSFPLFTWSIYLLVRKNNTLLHRVAAAILIGLALFTKSYALILLPLALLLSWNLIGPKNQSNSRIRDGALLTLILTFAVASLFFLNSKLSGNLLLLTEIRATEQASLIEKIAGMFSLDPVWFYLNGLIRLFWWSGFWSMVSPGLYFYAPIAIFGAVAAYGLFPKGAWQDPLFWQEVLPHLVVVFSFVAGMAWHASLFEIANASLGGGGRSGNEGWYLLIIAPSIFLVLLSPIKWISAEAGWCRLLQFLAAGMMLWNLLGRLSSYMYWSGSVRIHHFIRGMDLKDTIRALFDAGSWNAWLSLPGIIPPVWINSLLPLCIALFSSIFFLRGHNTYLSGTRAPRDTYYVPEAIGSQRCAS
jgi:hypothetical protein